MTVVIFSGPTLPTADVAAHIDAVCLPPAAQGDVYRCLDHKPHVIGIIDGYFHGVPSVWHKEILWAIAQGVQVFGSASMGALRAAELHSFGMTGVGRIFEDYASGELEDDDEVAVQHAPADLGFMPLSEPMVNIRATMDRAVADAVLDTAVAHGTLSHLKSLHYPDRTWQAMTARVAEIAEPDVAENFAAWLTTGKVDQKRTDAIAMLQRIANVQTPAASPPGFDFEPTLVWQRLLGECAGTGGGDDAVIDELRLQPARYDRAALRARERLLALRQADDTGTEADRAEHKRQLTGLRERHSLFTSAAFQRWLADQDLSEAALGDLVADDVRLAAVRTEIAGQTRRQIAAILQLSGGYAELRARASGKAELLAAHGLAGAGPDDTGLLPVQLAGWYFEQHLGMPMPDNMNDYARQHGFRDTAHFYTSLAREYLYLTLREKQ